MPPAAPGQPPDDRDELVAGLLAALMAADQLRAMTVVRQAMKRGWSADDVRFHMITPALHEMGARWQRREIGVGEEHLATHICEWLLFALAGRTRRHPTIGLRALVGCSEGERHCLGARIVAHVLAEQGWSVLYLGAATPASAWSQIVAARRPDVTVLSTTTTELLDEVGPALRRIKLARPECRTVVGGQAYAHRPGAAADLGADLLALDAGALVGQLRP